MKYQRFTLLGCEDREIRKFEFEARTQYPATILQEPTTALVKLGLRTGQKEKDVQIETSVLVSKLQFKFSFR